MSSEHEIETRIIEASYLLQAKVGKGPVDARKVQESQHIIETNQVDFVPFGLEFLEDLEEVINKARAKKMNIQDVRESLAQPIMQLKANASMFKYNLVGNLATIMLNFLEGISAVDDEAIEIVDAHHKTLKAIIVKRMQGSAGENGQALQQELKRACRRYFLKRELPVPGIFKAK